MSGAVESGRNGEHTPGPWSVAGEKTMRQQLITGGVAIRAHSKRYDAECAIFNLPANETFGGADEAIANARLIATSPELVDCIHDLLYLHITHHNHPLHAAARALLAKAEGRS